MGSRWLALLAAAARRVRVFYFTLFTAMRALRRGTTLGLDHGERLVCVGARADSVAADAPVAGVLDAIEKNHCVIGTFF